MDPAALKSSGQMHSPALRRENLRVLAQDLGYFLESFVNFFLAILGHFAQMLFVIGLL